MSPLKRQARDYMQAEARNCETATQLAENTAWHFDHDEWLDDELHWVWELALDNFPEER